jgi:hypothetical protein
MKAIDTIDPGVTGRARASEGTLLPTRAVCSRYSVCSRTVDRWVADTRLAFPQPTIINRRRYFLLAELVAWEALCRRNQNAPPLGRRPHAR